MREGNTREEKRSGVGDAKRVRRRRRVLSNIFKALHDLRHST